MQLRNLPGNHGPIRPTVASISPVVSCGCLAREAFERKLQAKLDALSDPKIRALISDAREKGVVCARRLHRIDPYLASRILRLAKAGLLHPKQVVDAAPNRGNTGSDWLLDRLEWQMRLAIGLAADTTDWFRREGELCGWELKRTGDSEFGWAWDTVRNMSRFSLPAELRPLRDRFLEICDFTFRQRETRRRAHLQRIGWKPKPTPVRPTFDDWFPPDILLPGMILTRFPRHRTWRSVQP